LSFQTFDFQAFASDLLGRQDAVAEFTIQRAGSLFVTGAGSVADAFADNTATPQFTGSAPANSTVVIEIDGAEVGRTTASAQGAWTFNVPQAAALSDGAHIIRAVQTSGALVSATSETRLIVDLAAPAPPTIDLETGLNVGSASDQRSEDPQLVLSGLAEAGSTVTVTEGFNRDAVGSARANDQGVWSLVLDAPRPSDIYQFHATARDAAGNSSTEVSRFITVSTGEPGIPVIGLVGDSGSSSTDAITNNVRPTFEGIAAPDTDIDVFAGNILIGRTRTDADGQFSVRAEFSLSDGEHLIFVGNNNPDSVGQRIVIDTAGPAAPTMSLVAADDTGTPGDGITGDSRPSFVGQVEAFSTVTIREIGPGTSVLGQVTAGADGSWSITLDDPLQAGRHDLIAQAVDLAGNRGAASAIVSIQVELIEGTGVSETLNGSAGKDTLVGHGGNDIINGGDAVDVLVGGPGADAFVFNSTTTWGDEIIDFSNGDRIEISQSALGPEFAPGLVSASRFVSGDDPVAGSANATFLYNTGTGQLSFDTDGTGSISAVTVAVLLDRASLSANDLLVV
jgi:Ca2+-binding RTX toxin-like protein